MRAGMQGGAPGAAPRLPGRVALVLIALSLLVAAACSPIYRNHGYAPTDADLAAITVGKDTRDTVAEAIGRPSAAGLLEDTGWFYVQSRWRQGGVRAPVEVERQVVVITFDTAGVVQNVERFGLEDGRVVALSRRVTESNIKGVSLISQLLGSFGRIRADQILE